MKEENEEEEEEDGVGDEDRDERVSREDCGGMSRGWGWSVNICVVIVASE